MQQNFDIFDEYTQANNNDNQELKQLINVKKDQFRVEIRKKNNQFRMNQKRFQMQNSSQSKSLEEKLQSIKIEKVIDDFIAAYNNQNLEEISKQVELLRVITTTKSDTDIVQNCDRLLYESKAINFLVTFLEPQFSENFNLQRDTLWIVSNFLAYDCEWTEHCFNLGIAKTLVNFLYNNNIQLREHALLSISNLIADNQQIKEIVINLGIVQILSETLPKKSTSDELIINFSYCVRNICHQQLLIKDIEPLFINMQILISSVQDEQVWENIFSAIESLVQDVEDEKMEYIMEKHNGLIITLINWLDKNYEANISFVFCVLQIIRNFTSCNDDKVAEQLIQFGLLKQLFKYGKHRDERCRRLVAFCYSNLCACSIPIIQYLIDDPLTLVEIFREAKSDTYIVRKEAMLAVSNIAQISDIQQLSVLINQGIIEILMEGLTINDNVIKKNILCALDCIFTEGNQLMENRNLFHNPYVKLFSQKNGVNLIYKIQKNAESQQIINIANQLIDKFFDIPEVDTMQHQIKESDDDETTQDEQIQSRDNYAGDDESSDNYNQIKLNKNQE